jgi:hypothetical protein
MKEQDDEDGEDILRHRDFSGIVLRESSRTAEPSVSAGASNFRWCFEKHLLKKPWILRIFLQNEESGKLDHVQNEPISPLSCGDFDGLTLALTHRLLLQ